MSEPPKDRIRAAAEAIAKELFTNGGTGAVAYRLELVARCGVDMGGWSYESAVIRIERVLRSTINNPAKESRSDPAI